VHRGSRPGTPRLLRRLDVWLTVSARAEFGQTVVMFVIELVYKAKLSEIDAHMAAHVAFLNKYYAAGKFLVSGRKIPRDGGIILAVAKSRAELEAIVKEDPFHEHGLAEFRIIQFRASQRAADLPIRME
jgi:uncharacterized protein YciI